jgi:hypothetical protein
MFYAVDNYPCLKVKAENNSLLTEKKYSRTVNQKIFLKKYIELIRNKKS